MMSRQLAEIKCDVPVARDWQKLEQGAADRQGLIALYRELEFRKLLQELGEEKDTTESAALGRNYQLITTTDALETILSKVRKSRQAAIFALTSGESPLASELIGLALAWEQEAACHIPP